MSPDLVEKYLFMAPELIMDAEMVRMILNASMEIETDEEALALDIIHIVGPGGTFLTHQHTFNHMRDQSRNDLFNRRNLEDWHEECAGASLLDRAYSKAQDILESHQPPELPKGAQAAMEEILKEFDSDNY